LALAWHDIFADFVARPNFGCAPTTNLSDLEYILTVSLNVPQDFFVQGQRFSLQNPEIEASVYAFWFGVFFSLVFAKSRKRRGQKHFLHC